MKKWKSNAEWYNNDKTGTYITTDSHYTRAGAENVCLMLIHDGFGGERKEFPLKTWVEEIAQY